MLPTPEDLGTNPSRPLLEHHRMLPRLGHLQLRFGYLDVSSSNLSYLEPSNVETP